MNDNRKAITARCPKCNKIVMASVIPAPMDKEFKKEIADLITDGCVIQTEPIQNVKDNWHDGKYKECLKDIDKKEESNLFSQATL